MLFHPLAVKELFKDKQYPVIKTPQHKGQRGAVPKTGQQPDYQHVENPSPLSHTVPAHRDIHIVPEEGGQRDVPAAPEPGDRDSGIWVIEVFEVMEAHHAAHTDRHVGITAEIKENLHRIRRNRNPCADSAVVGGCVSKQCIHRRRHGIRDKHFLRQTYDKPAKTGGEFGESLGAVDKFVGNGFITDDRTGNKLRETAQICAEEQDIILHRHISPVDVDDIRHDLEGVERDTDRQYDPGRRDRQGGDPAYDLNKQTGILKDRDEQKVTDYVYNQPRFTAFPRFLRAVDKLCKEEVVNAMENIISKI